MFEQLKERMGNTAKQLLTATLECSGDFVKDAKNALLEVVAMTKESANE